MEKRINFFSSSLLNLTFLLIENKILEKENQKEKKKRGETERPKEKEIGSKKTKGGN